MARKKKTAAQVAAEITAGDAAVANKALGVSTKRTRKTAKKNADGSPKVPTAKQLAAWEKSRNNPTPKQIAARALLAERARARKGKGKGKGKGSKTTSKPRVVNAVTAVKATIEDYKTPPKLGNPLREEWLAKYTMKKGSKVLRTRPYIPHKKKRAGKKWSDERRSKFEKAKQAKKGETAPRAPLSEYGSYGFAF